MKKNFTLLILVCLINFVSYSQNIIALQPVATGFVRPATIENCGDSRLFVVQQTGQIIIIDSTGNKRNKPFLDISDRMRKDLWLPTKSNSNLYLIKTILWQELRMLL